MEELVRLRGAITYQMLDANGTPLHDPVTVKNMVVEAGRAWMGKRIQSNSPPTDTINYCGLGSSTTAANATQTALLSQLLRKTIGTIVTTNLTGADPYFSCLTSFGTNEANGVIAEVGLFTSSSGGTMFCRGLITSVTKTTTNTFSVTYDVHF